MIEHRLAILALVLALAAIAQPGHAADFCITDGTALDNALQLAQANNEDDTLRIVAGTHAPPGSAGTFYFAEIGHALLVEGGYQTPDGGPPCSQHSADPALTIIDGAGTHTLLRIDSGFGSGDITLRNLTLQDGRAAGISSPIELLGSGANTVTLENAIVRANAGDLFQSMYYVPAVWLAADQGAIVVRNVLFADNDAPANVVPILITKVQNAGAGVIVNDVTVTANGAVSASWAAEFDVEGSLSIANGIFRGNTGADLRIVQNSGTITLDHCDIGVRTGTAPSTETATLDVDPGFISAGDYRLDPNSPLRDAGNAAAFGGIGAFDLAGMPRIAFGAVDIGAYEVPDDTLFRAGFEP